MAKTNFNDDFYDQDEGYDGHKIRVQQAPMLQRILFSSRIHFCLLLIVCGAVAFGLPMVWHRLWHESSVATIESDLRYNCYPLQSSEKQDKANCPLKMCQWDDEASEGQIKCYWKIEDKSVQGFIPRYTVSKQLDNSYLLKALNLPSYLSLTNTNLSLSPVVESNVQLTIRHYSPNHASVLIKPQGEADDLWSKHLDYNYPPTINESQSNADVDVADDSDSFVLTIKRKSTGSNLFAMGGHSPFIFAQGLREITTAFLNDHVYGLGQSHKSSFKLNFTKPEVSDCLCVLTR